MPAGKYDTRITIKAKPAEDDELGQPDGENVDVFRVSAQRRTNRAREVLASGRDLDEQLETFTVRYRTDITPAHLVEWNGDTYEIQSMPIVGRRVELDLICRKTT